MPWPMLQTGKFSQIKFFLRLIVCVGNQEIFHTYTVHMYVYVQSHVYIHTCR